MLLKQFLSYEVINQVRN